MSSGSWRVALKVAAREARRQRSRSIAVVLALALPVAAVTAADVVVRSAHLSALQQAQRQLGGAAAVVTWSGQELVEQDPVGDMDPIFPPSSGATSISGFVDKPAPALPAALLPSGANVVGEVDTYAFLASAANGDSFQVRGSDFAAAGPRGTVIVESGQLPTAAGDIALSPSTASALAVRTGASVRVPGTSLTFRVVGIVSNRYSPGDQVAFTTEPVAVQLQTQSTPEGTGGVSQWYVSSAVPIGWATVLAFNHRGWAVISRYVLGHQPPASAVPFDHQPVNPQAEEPAPDSRTARVGSALLVAMLVLEVIFVAGPAFAVGARRRRHELAVIGAAGARPRDLAVVVAADGVVLGAVAALTGAAVGLGAGALTLAALRAWADKVPGPYTTRGWEIAGIALLAVVSGLIGALLPAFSVSRAPLSQVLRGQQAPSRLSFRPALAGVAALAISVGLVLDDLDEVSNGGVPVALVLSAVLAEVGLVLLTPALLVGAARLSGRLPLWGRMAVRDSARNRSAAGPAVAAVIAVAAACSTGLVYGSSYLAHDRLTYQASMPTGDGMVLVGSSSGATVPAGTVLNSVRTALPGATLVELQGPGGNRQVVVLPPATPGCPSPNIQFQAGGEEEGESVGLFSGGPPQCPGFNFDATSGPAYLVDSGTGLGRLLGGATGQQASAALRSGRAVVFDASLVSHGQVSLALGPGAPSRVVIPAVAVSWPGPADTAPGDVVLSPSVADRLRLTYSPFEIYIRHASAQPAARIRAANTALSQLGLDGIDIQGPYSNGIGIMLLAIVGADLLLAFAVAMAATALLLVDASPDLRILAAVGAAPGGRRRLAVGRAGLICGLGSLLGVAAGLGVGIALVSRIRHVDGGAGIPGTELLSNGYPLSIPWLHLLAVLVVPPVMAAATALLLKGPRLDVEIRRPT